MNTSLIPCAGKLLVLVFGFVLMLQSCESNPVLVLVANGSDITINFPGENNNNHLFSIVSASGNNNPSMFDWIGGNGANKAPTITLGASDAHQEPPHRRAENLDNSEENDNPVTERWGPLLRPGTTGKRNDDEPLGILQTLSTTTEAIPVNTTALSMPISNTTPKTTRVTHSS
ncbi:uncharacterized protein LOC125956183 [Anopheles darlingi]|uniref:uncharacterized protein LOC125956183 n=1 Tax=Anopheles darlingi TaxID=43151 RepID=UPI0020FFF691|nr:uncharacterized protein LOC125956183 [Anopheles darlingi]